MQVRALAKRLYELDVARKRRHEPHFDLRIVRGHDRFIALSGHEGGADAAALRGPRMDVLKIGVGRGEPAGCRRSLLERRVYPSVADRPLKADDRLAQFDGVAVLKEGGEELLAGEGPVVFASGNAHGEVREGGGVGGVAGFRLARRRQSQLVEEDLLKLLGARQVDLASDGVVGRAGGREHPPVEVLPQLFEKAFVHGYPRVLHSPERAGNRHLEVEQGSVLPPFGEFGVEGLGELDERRGGSRSIVGVDVVEKRRLAFSALDLSAQIADDEVVEVVDPLVRMQ